MDTEIGRVVVHPSGESRALLERLSRRGFLDDEALRSDVRRIVQRVRKEGDSAVLELTNRFDCPDAPRARLSVPAERIEEAFRAAPPELLSAMRLAAANILRFHERQKAHSWFAEEPGGVLLGQYLRPHDRVGVLVPSASAPLFSSLMMAALAAKAAGVPEVAAAAAPGPDGAVHPYILAAARVSGVSEVYACGGAQAAAAFAFGTETIPRPRTRSPAPAARIRSSPRRSCSAGSMWTRPPRPSEILVIADETANPVWAAADMISQAEHSEDCSAVLVSTSAPLAEAVGAELRRQAKRLPRRETIEASLKRYGAVDCGGRHGRGGRAGERAGAGACGCAYGGTRGAVAHRLRHAGAAFLGGATPEALADYAAGPNHILPTGGAARFASSLSALDFMKRTNFLRYTDAALRRMIAPVARLARAEGLEGHAGRDGSAPSRDDS